jgi:primosomal protein N' (replication factor Y)
MKHMESREVEMKEEILYADIIVDISHEKLDKSFQYIIPSYLKDKLQVGMTVLIPFGRGNRKIKGYVTQITDRPGFDITKMKELIDIDPDGAQIESKLIALAGWIRENYGSTMVQALKTVLPVKEKVKEKQRRFLHLKISKEELSVLLEECRKKHYTAKARLLEAFCEETVLSYELVTGKLNITSSVMKGMEKAGVLTITTEQVYRNPKVGIEKKNSHHHLNKEQQKAVDIILQDYHKGIHKTYLLHGITGSGKTEVYMELIASAVKEGKQAIVLIPEIALTYQTVMRFYRRFGERVSIMNSRLSKGERYDQFERAKRGELDVMIGPRSALFTPFTNLGFIIIDEEHEAAYKSENAPRYHARETAIERARMEQASVVLGSATPSIDAYYKGLNHEYKLLELKSRAKKSILPVVYTEDLREELKQGNRSILSGRLHDLIEERLVRKEQVMLFLNRRGYAGFISCRSCGHVIKCPHCDVSLALHNGGRLVCHYCGHEEPNVDKCPECASPFIGTFQVGTQQIEAFVQKEFPKAGVLRMDMDTTKSKDGHEKILAAFTNQEADILIGTQMIVKGHDFPNVTLVGILAADLSLNVSDYRAGERTFQLLTQAAGRAGRGDKAGEVVIQTYHPDHYSIIAAAKQDYQEFYQQEISYRQLLGYPPVSNLLAIHAACHDCFLLDTAAEYLKKYIEKIYKKEDLQVIGPADEMIAKINDIYRKVIYLKHIEYAMLTRIQHQLERYIEINEGFKKVSIQFDFNPMN